MPMIQQPVRKTTAALLHAATQRFTAEVQLIANMAIEDGEMPTGTRMDLNNGQPVWLVDTPEKPLENP
jgi:hypothetical protein